VAASAVLRRCLARFRHRQLPRGWTQWVEQVEASAAALTQLGGCVAHLRQRRSAAAWRQWVECTSDSQETTRLVRKTLAKVVHRALAGGWGRWVLLAEVLAHARTALRRIVRRQSVRVLATWRGVCAARAHLERSLSQTFRLMRQLRLGRGWRTWWHGHGYAGPEARGRLSALTALSHGHLTLRRCRQAVQWWQHVCTCHRGWGEMRRLLARPLERPPPPPPARPPPPLHVHVSHEYIPESSPPPRMRPVSQLLEDGITAQLHPRHRGPRRSVYATTAASRGWERTRVDVGPRRDFSFERWARH